MIVDIFYSLVLFQILQYWSDFFWYQLIKIHEDEFWTLECIFLSPTSKEVSILFTHKDMVDSSKLSTKNWRISWEDSVLVSCLIDALQSSDTTDFNFFKSKEFYDEIPFGTVLTVTSKCNIFCYYCFNDYDYPLKDRNLRKSIWIDNYKKIVDILYEAWTRDIIITGGEPFVFEAFWELLDYITSKNIYIRINTNGTLLSDETLERLNDNYALTLMVSMHEFNNSDYFSVNEKWAKMIQGLQGLKNFEDKFTKKVEQLEKVKNYPNLTLDFLTILSKKNIILLEWIFKWVLSRFDLANWHFFRLYSTDTWPGISRPMINLAIHKLYKLNQQYNKNFKIVDSVPFCVTKDTEIASQVIDGELTENHNVKTIITTDGYIQIMSAFDSNLWSIFEHDLLEVWKGDYVQKMLKNGFLPEECSDCIYKHTCRWGSRMDANIYNGSYSAFDPLGDINNKVVK